MQGWILGVLAIGCGLTPLTVAMATTQKPDSQADVWERGRVARVLDGDTVVLENGQSVRLLDINTPEKGRDGMPADPFADEATRRTRTLVDGKEVNLRLGRQRYDTYGRLLAQVVLPDGRWVNGMLVSEGLAVVYSFADNRLWATELLALEDQARAAKRGLWALPRWQPRNAERCCPAADMGHFQLVEGTVKSVARTKDRWFLNFGDDYRHDFTVEIQIRATGLFKKAGIKDLRKAYDGRRVRVRGMLAPVNGALIRVTHPEQLEVLG